jgi:hypothetical protein
VVGARTDGSHLIAAWTEQEIGMHTNKPSRARVLMTTSLAAVTILVATSDMGWARSGDFGRGTFHAGKSSRNFTPRIARNVPHSSIAPASRVSSFNGVHPIINRNPTSSASNGPSQGSAPGRASTVSSFNRVHPIINQNPTSFASNGLSQRNAPGSTNGVVNISNGVTRSAISSERGGLTVTSTRPGTITVTNAKGSSVTLAGGSVSLSGAATPVTAGAGLQVVHLMNGTVVASSPSGKVAGNIAKGAFEAVVGVPYVTYGASIAAGYGFLRGGIPGTYNSVKSFGKETYDFLTDFF